MKGPQTPEWQRWAQFRLSVIGELLFCPPPWGQLKTALDRLSGRTYQHPIDPKRQVRFGASTIERWYYQAKDAPDPIAVLGRRIRSDAGTRKTVSEPFLAALKEQYESHRSWSVQLHYDNLIALSEEQPQLQPMPSYKTVLRSMRDNGWYRRREPVRPTAGQQLAAQRLERREVRSYEVPHIHGLWHLDFHQASISFLNAAGQWQHPIALAILDDYSRICCHLQFYLAETAECLIHGLMQALMKRGLPRALLTDNGAAMLAEETRNGLERLGIDHKTTLPYSPYQNGKQEVFWGQLEGRLLSMLKGVDGMNLSLLNTAAQAWVEQEYHRKVHREIQTTPIARLMNGKKRRQADAGQ